MNPPKPTNRYFLTDIPRLRALFEAFATTTPQDRRGGVFTDDETKNRVAAVDNQRGSGG